MVVAFKFHKRKTGPLPYEWIETWCEVVELKPHPLLCPPYVKG